MKKLIVLALVASGVGFAMHHHTKTISEEIENLQIPNMESREVNVKKPFRQEYTEDDQKILVFRNDSLVNTIDLASELEGSALRLLDTPHFSEDPTIVSFLFEKEEIENSSFVDIYRKNFSYIDDGIFTIEAILYLKDGEPHSFVASKLFVYKVTEKGLQFEGVYDNLLISSLQFESGKLVVEYVKDWVVNSNKQQVWYSNILYNKELIFKDKYAYIFKMDSLYRLTEFNSKFGTMDPVYMPEKEIFNKRN